MLWGTSISNSVTQFFFDTDYTVYFEPPATLKAPRPRRIKILSNRNERFGKDAGPPGSINALEVDLRVVYWYISLIILNREGAKDAKVLNMFS